MTNFQKAKIVGCKKASIRKNPSCTRSINNESDVVGYLNKDETLSVDASVRVFDWTDKEYYKCSSSAGDGYILTELVEII